MPINIEVDKQNVGTMGPDYQQGSIGEPPTTVLTYTGDQNGKLFVSDLTKNTKPTELNLSIFGCSASTEITIHNALFRALMSAELTATRK